MPENRDERARDELEEELLSPLQELFPIIENIPQTTISAHEINATNVVSGVQYNVILPAGARKPASSPKSPPFTR